MLVVSRSLHQLYADTTRPLLSQYFQKLNELHSMQRDGVIGTLCVCVWGGGVGGGRCGKVAAHHSWVSTQAT